MVLVEYNEIGYGYDEKRSGYHTAEKLCGSRFSYFRAWLNGQTKTKTSLTI